VLAKENFTMLNRLVDIQMGIKMNHKIKGLGQSYSKSTISMMPTTANQSALMAYQEEMMPSLKNNKS